MERKERNTLQKLKDWNTVTCKSNNLTYLNIYLLIYLLTPWTKVILEKSISCKLVKKLLTFYGTRRLITTFTNPSHLSLSWATSTKSMPPHPTSWISVLILSSHLRLCLPSGLFPSDPLQTLYTPLMYSIRATCPANLIFLRLITRTILGEEKR